MLSIWRVLVGTFNYLYAFLSFKLWFRIIGLSSVFIHYLFHVLLTQTKTNFVFLCSVFLTIFFCYFILINSHTCWYPLYQRWASSGVYISRSQKYLLRSITHHILEHQKCWQWSCKNCQFLGNANGGVMLLKSYLNLHLIIVPV